MNSVVQQRARMVVAAWFVVLLVGGSQRAFAQERAGDGLGIDPLAAVRLRASTEPARPYVHQAFTLRLEIEVDADFARDHLAPPSARRLDVPFLVWTQRERGGAAGIELLTARPGPEATLSIAVDGRTGRAALARAGAVMRYALDLRLRATRTDARLAPRVELVWAERFETDLFGGRRPIGPQRASIAADWEGLDLRELPSAGAPPGFEGLVGAFELTAVSHAPERVRAGDGFEVRVVVRGDAEPERLAERAPRLVRERGYHALGALAEPLADGCAHLFEVVAVPSGAPAELAFELDVFEPDTGYRTLRVELDQPERVDLRIAAGALTDGPAHGEGAGAGAQDVDGRWLWPSAIAAASALLAIAFLLHHRRRRPSADPVRERARDAARAATDPWAGLVAYLAVRPGVPPGTADGAGLQRALVEAGVERDLAARVERGVRAATAARFGGGRAPDGARDLLSELEASEFEFERSPDRAR